MSVENFGHIVQVIGPVVDIEFAPGMLPDLFHAIRITSEDQDEEIKATLTQHIDLTLEAMQHLGNNTVRCVAMSSTDGLRRKMRATDTEAPIMVPVGKNTLGRLLNVLGQPIDELGAVETDKHYPIHRLAPPISEQRTSREILETGIKVVDLLAPFTKGGKVGLFGGAGVGKTVIIQELIRNIAYRARRFLRFLRRGRAYPGGQRPLAGYEGVRGYREDCPGLRADERTAGCAPAGRADRFDHGGVLPG